jgi:hypothetical protein
MKSIFILAHEQARQNALQGVKTAPQGYVVEIRPKTRSLEQNALLHALIQEIAKSVIWAGSKQDIDVWKRLLTAAWLRARGDQIQMLPAIDGHGVDIVFRRTSDLSIAELNELIEYIQSWMVEQGLEI